ncbi:metallophosphoesterase [Tissierella creatinophila]|uniref:Putative metallophosphoesterase n=1 Tax=Tissierella creatinophila DSM 6911 TaxID=1123403 RepID=A0A1U7M6Z9_TISCR|nr:metallophosphoesterase [Tissierella creatinophila]OLS02989.1 putative metallophosphoesterase [Tissierella creatinophila DSM 6911]
MTFYKNKLFITLFAILGFMIFFRWQNNEILTTKVDYKSTKLPKDFDGFTIIQISDLHNKLFGKDQRRLLEKIENAKPDIIVITGDLIDRRRYNLETSMVFIRKAVKIAQVYYVPGNHEAWSGKYKTIKENLVNEGVKVLEDEKVELVKNHSKIEIIGLKDPAFYTSSYLDGRDLSKLEKELKSLSNNSSFQILLCHRPDLFSIYAENNIDLSFTGHAHGGQFRIPFVGGLLAPDQGLFPKYTSGMYTKGSSSMIVNRGLGNSIIPIRIFNRPEIVKVVLKSGK